MEILRLISGDPNGSGVLSDYQFEKIAVYENDEHRIKAQLDEWMLVDSYVIDKLTGSGDFYGCGTSGKYKTPLSRLSERCFFHNGEFLGYRTDGMILFVNGKHVGVRTYRNYDDDSQEVGEYSLERNSDA